MADGLPKSREDLDRSSEKGEESLSEDRKSSTSDVAGELLAQSSESITPLQKLKVEVTSDRKIKEHPGVEVTVEGVTIVTIPFYDPREVIVRKGGLYVVNPDVFDDEEVSYEGMGKPSRSEIRVDFIGSKPPKKFDFPRIEGPHLKGFSLKIDPDDFTLVIDTKLRGGEQYSEVALVPPEKGEKSFKIKILFEEPPSK